LKAAAAGCAGDSRIDVWKRRRTEQEKNVFKTLIVPLDGSELAAKSVPYAGAVARATSGQVILLRALDAYRAQAEPDAAAQLEEQAAALRDGGVPAQAVTTGVAGDDIGRTIVDEATARGCDLMVLSTHGRTGIGRFIYGSVADRVLRLAKTPVMVIPSGAEQPWPTDRAPHLLVPLDFSELAGEALGPAVELAKSLGARMTLLHVVPPPSYAYAEGYAYVIDLPEQQLEEGSRMLDEQAERLRADGLDVQTEALIGYPSAQVAESAAEKGADLIVMATHGRGGLARLVLGSVATGTVQRAAVPVLLLKPAAIQAASEAAVPAATAEAASDGSVTLHFTRHELDLLERGLSELLYLPERDRAQAVSARDLLARLRQAEGTLSRA
jgi:nucleotide-binding universal stress UspA family protein